MILRTREKLIESARQVFARKGVEKTTMNDIAVATGMSRRTIYVYFRSKNEIYRAVIESECEELVSSLRQIVNSDISPSEKIRLYLNVSIDNLDSNISSYYSISGNTVDEKRIERIRRTSIAIKEEILRSIIIEGVRVGEFEATLSRHVMTSIVFIKRGLESTSFHGKKSNLGLSKNVLKKHLTEFVIRYLTNNPNSNETT